MENAEKKSIKLIAANLTVLLLTAISGIRFSVAYYSYFLVITGVFLLFDFEKSGKNYIYFWERDRNIRIFVLGILLFYGSIVVASILNDDLWSMTMGFSLGLFSFAFFAAYYVRGRYDTDVYFLLGIVLVVIANTIFSLLSIKTGMSQVFQGFFLHRNALGDVLSFILPFCVYCFWHYRKVWDRILAASAFCVAGALLLLTQSRGAILGVTVGFVGTIIAVLFAYREKLTRKYILWGIAALFLVGACGGALIYNISAFHRGTQEFGGERRIMIESSFQMWQDHKLIGIGMRNWGDYYYSEKYHPLEGKEQGHSMPHNMPIYFLSTNGIIGGIGYSAFMLLLFGLVVNLLRKDKSSIWVAMLFAYLAFAAESMVDATVSNKNVIIPFYFLMGYGFGTVYYNGSKSKEIPEGKKL